RLNADGLFTVSRWYAPGEVNETGRLVSLAVATLLATGAAEPRRHRFHDQARGGFYLDLTPPTDARPFFFNQLGFARIFDPHVFSHFTHTGVFAGNLIAKLTLALLVVISIALVAATIIVPLRPTLNEAGWRLVVGGTAYFALLGVGFVLIDIA